jgi:hypothetical protein
VQQQQRLQMNQLFEARARSVLWQLSKHSSAYLCMLPGMGQHFSRGQTQVNALQLHSYCFCFAAASILMTLLCSVGTSKLSYIPGCCADCVCGVLCSFLNEFIMTFMFLFLVNMMTARWG